MKIINILIIMLGCIFGFYTAQACTNWSSVGDTSYQHATLLAKNRDAPLGGSETLEVLHPNDGYAYLGLMYNSDHKSKEYPDIAAGINEKGLVIVNNSAVTLPIKHRDAEESRLMKTILTHYANVKAVLKDQKKLFNNSQINDLVIADKHETAIIEIGDKSYAIRTKQNGTMAHTNTYIFKGMRKENLINIPDNTIRLKRIKYLLSHYQKPLTMNDFIEMSYDHNAGPIDSVFRLFTVATWIAKIPQQGDTQLYVRFTNPYQNYDVFHLRINNDLWKLKGKLTGAEYGILSKHNLELQKDYMKSIMIKQKATRF